MRLWIRGGRVIDPANNIDQHTELFVADGRIVALGSAPEGFQADLTVNAADCLVAPGFVDLYARLHTAAGDGPEAQLQAALQAGVTTLLCPPDTTRVVLDHAAAVNDLLRSTQMNGGPRVLPMAALSAGLEGQGLSNLAALRQAGCLAASQGDTALGDYNALRHSFEYAASTGLLLVMWPQDAQLAANGLIHEGSVSTRLGLAGIPACAETVAVDVLIQLAELTGARLHLSRLSSAGGVARVARAKAAGLSVSADVAMANLLWCDTDIGAFDSQFHTRPPLRGAADRAALLAGLRDGSIDAICSNHHAQHPDAKLAPFPHTEAGMAMLPDWPMRLGQLVAAGDLTIQLALASVTHNPARVLGVTAGSLLPGTEADIVILEPAADGPTDEQAGWHVRQLLVAGRLNYNAT